MLTISNKKIILIAGIGIFLMLVLGAFILKSSYSSKTTFLWPWETKSIVIESSKQKEFHSANFFELKDLMIKDFKNSAILDPEDNHSVKIGITSHHLPTALPLISSFYKELARSVTPFQTFVIVGPDHLERCRAPIATTKMPYSTAFGAVEIDQEIEDRILQVGVFLDDNCFENEHSIGVQAIFIKYLFPGAKIVPLLFSASATEESIKRIAEELSSYGDKITLIISADFSHYQTKDRAKQLDSESEQMIKNLDVSSLGIEHVDSPPAIKLAILLAKKLGVTNPQILGRANSFDFTGIPENTTGYLNVLFTDKNAAGQVSLLFLGDLMFDRNIRQAAKKQGNDFIFEPLKNWLSENDLAIANLEGPITENRSVSVNTLPGEQNNFIFTFDPSLAGTLFSNNIKLVNLGNNHIINFGQRGLESTKQYLDSAGVSYFGAPANERSIAKDTKGVKVVLVNYNQFVGSVAVERTAVIEEIKKTKAQADIVIVYAHWGTEYNSIANGAIKNLAHEFIDAGADLIIGSHPHVVQDKEEYQGKMIYYSLGNFIFDQYFSLEVKRGLAVKAKINLADKKMEFEETSLCLQNNGQTIICGL